MVSDALLRQESVRDAPPLEENLRAGLEGRADPEATHELYLEVDRILSRTNPASRFLKSQQSRFLRTFWLQHRTNYRTFLRRKEDGTNPDPPTISRGFYEDIARTLKVVREQAAQALPPAAPVAPAVSQAGGIPETPLVFDGDPEFDLGQRWRELSGLVVDRLIKRFGPDYPIGRDSRIRVVDRRPLGSRRLLRRSPAKDPTLADFNDLLRGSRAGLIIHFRSKDWKEQIESNAWSGNLTIYFTTQGPKAEERLANGNLQYVLDHFDKIFPPQAGLEGAPRSFPRRGIEKALDTWLESQAELKRWKSLRETLRREKEEQGFQNAGDGLRAAQEEAGKNRKAIFTVMKRWLGIRNWSKSIEASVDEELGRLRDTALAVGGEKNQAVEVAITALERFGKASPPPSAGSPSATAGLEGVGPEAVRTLAASETTQPRWTDPAMFAKPTFSNGPADPEVRAILAARAQALKADQITFIPLTSSQEDVITIYPAYRGQLEGHAQMEDYLHRSDATLRRFGIQFAHLERSAEQFRYPGFVVVDAASQSRTQELGVPEWYPILNAEELNAYPPIFVAAWALHPRLPLEFFKGIEIKAVEEVKDGATGTRYMVILAKQA